MSAEKIPVIKTREKEGGTEAVATQSVTSKGSTKMIANKVLQDQGLNASVMKMKQVVLLVGAASSKGNLDGGESPNPLKQNSSPGTVCIMYDILQYEFPLTMYSIYKYP